MRDILQHLFDHKNLSRQEAYDALTNIGKGGYNATQISAFLTVFQMRHITVDELTGFRDALLDLCLSVDLATYDPIDLCGTGGDGKDTFNVSTLASFVTAGAGIHVAKHGNYGVSSTCGSSNVMEHLGYTFTNDLATLEKQIDTAGICFLHAPLFHPAMKHVGPLRRQLGTKTFFNMLGPMVNPARPRNQLVGVFSLELARLYSYLYQQTEKRYTILHSLDGYDEISLTGAFKKIDREGEHLIAPPDIGFATLSPRELFGGQTVSDAASIFMGVLKGLGTEAQNAVVIVNSALAIHTATPGTTVDEAISRARESLKGGMALQSFKKLLAA